MDHLIKKSANTELHPTNMNQDDGFYISRLWNPRRKDTTGILQKCYNFILLRLQIHYFNTDAHIAVSLVTHASADHSQCCQTAGSDQTAITVHMISTFHC